MAARVGRVVFWAATIVAVSLLGFIGLGIARCTNYWQVACPVSRDFQTIVTVFAIGVWLFGWACKYVLAGPAK